MSAIFRMRTLSTIYKSYIKKRERIKSTGSTRF